MHHHCSEAHSTQVALHTPASTPALFTLLLADSKPSDNSLCVYLQQTSRLLVHRTGGSLSAARARTALLGDSSSFTQYDFQSWDTKLIWKSMSLTHLEQLLD